MVLDPRKIYEKNLWNHKISMRKNFGPIYGGWLKTHDGTGPTEFSTLCNKNVKENYVTLIAKTYLTDQHHYIKLHGEIQK